MKFLKPEKYTVMRRVKFKEGCNSSGLKPPVILAMIVMSIFSVQVSTIEGQGREPVVVSAKWLEENLNTPGMVILHISPVVRDYENGHIEGARFLWPGWLIESNERESTVPADINSMKKRLEGLGVSNNSHIILCGTSGNINQVCRIYITMDNLGLGGRVSILDGGFDAWVSEGMKISLVTPSVLKGKLTISKKETFVNTDWVVKNLNNRAYTLIDARPKSAYDGLSGAPRQGHIPGAKSLPSNTLYDAKTYRFAAPDKLKEIFAGLEISQSSRPVFYCNTGNSACPGYVAAVIAGYDPILYDGSMEAWGNRLELPLEKE
jgi:thiosulfate/3-mercaptopyruvate sulfurtransferase